LFIINAFQAGEGFTRAKYRNLADFLLRCETLPLLLAGLSCQLAVRGSLPPVNDEFFNPLMVITSKPRSFISFHCWCCRTPGLICRFGMGRKDLPYLWA
jgi:hypothetical protein